MVARKGPLCCIVALATFASTCALSRAQTIAPGAQVEGVTLTTADVTQFLTALNAALKPNDTTVPIAVNGVLSSEMPGYDPYYHYVGMETGPRGRVLIVWMNAEQIGDLHEDQMLGAFALAVADGGYGGADFKALYDIYAAKDKRLSWGSVDPYLNRHKFAAAIVRMIRTLGS